MLSFFVVLLIVLILPQNNGQVFAAGPAGVDSGLELWLSADSGTQDSGGNSAENGEAVVTWQDQSDANRDASKIDGTGATLSTTGLNYNPTLVFSGSNNYSASDTGLPSGNADRSIFIVASEDDIGSWRYVFGLGTFGNSQAFDFGNRSGTGSVFITTHSGQTVETGSWEPVGSARLAFGTSISDTLYLSINGGGLVTGSSGLNTILDGTVNIGSNSQGNEYWDGNISEVIFFDRALTSTEQQRIYSYLALKYGFSLDQSTPQSYLASGSNLMWDKDATDASTYDNGLFGIGRDDSSNLAQIKSRGQTSTNVIILEAVGEGSNGAGNFVDMNDLEFLVIGDNNGAASWTTTGAPSGYSILARQWKKQEQGDVGEVRLDFDVADLDFNIPAPLDADAYYFIYDTDNDGSLADETPQSMSNQGSNIWRVTVNFGAGGLFTLASTETPAISSLSPADNSTNATTTANLVITFNKSVSVDTGNITIKRTSDDVTVETIDVTSGQVTGGGGAAITINPSITLTEGVDYYIQIPNTAFYDSQDAYFIGINNTTGWNFTIADSTNPIISNISAASITNTGSTISWTTNENASTRVSYGLTSSYGTNTAETDTSPRVTSHSVSLNSLLACTTYHYQVRSIDGATNTTTSSDQTFTTTGCTADVVPTNTTSNTVTVSSGGTTTLSESDTEISVEAPADFTDDASSVVIQIKSVSSSTVLGSLGRPPSVPNEVGSVVFDVKAIINGNTVLDSFDAPVTITYQYSEADTSGLDEGSFWLYHYHNGAWEALEDCTITTSTNTISCTTDSFSIFGLFGQQAASGSSGNSNSEEVCARISPSNVPDLFQIDVSNTKATLYFTPLMNQVTNYYISYGYTPDDQRFGVFTHQGPSTGVLSYTINHLNPNSVYYFKVRPQNNCMTGNWSNQMKVATVKQATGGRRYYKNFLARVLAVFPKSITEVGTNDLVVASKIAVPKLSSCEYQVKPGDSLWRIALAYLQSGSRYKEILEKNSLTSSVLRVGQILKIGC